MRTIIRGFVDIAAIVALAHFAAWATTASPEIDMGEPGKNYRAYRFQASDEEYQRGEFHVTKATQ